MDNHDYRIMRDVLENEVEQYEWEVPHLPELSDWTDLKKYKKIVNAIKELKNPYYDDILFVLEENPPIAIKRLLMKTLDNLNIQTNLQSMLLSDETHHKIVQYTLRKVYKDYKKMGKKDKRLNKKHLKDLMYRNNANEEEMYVHILCMLNTMELFVKSLGLYHQKAMKKLLGHKWW